MQFVITGWELGTVTVTSIYLFQFMSIGQTICNDRYAITRIS